MVRLATFYDPDGNALMLAQQLQAAVNLVPYTVRLYRSGPKADTFTEEELDRIQQGHLDFVASQRPVDRTRTGRSATSPTRRCAASASCGRASRRRWPRSRRTRR